jgi:hypothetical protein
MNPGPVNPRPLGQFMYLIFFKISWWFVKTRKSNFIRIHFVEVRIIIPCYLIDCFTYLFSYK